jgi:FkbM family methyltransferase
LTPEQFIHLAGVKERLGIDRVVLVDVGSRGGLPPLWDAHSELVSAVGFEPDERSYRELVLSSGSGSGTTHINAALNRTEGEVELNLARDPGDSSLYPPNQQFLSRFPEAERFDVVDRITLNATTLDKALQFHSIDKVDFIKLDTQGSELDILTGGPETLEHGVFGLEIEVELNEMYEGQPLFGAVDEFVRPYGFELIDLAPTYWKQSGWDRLGGPKGQIVYADALYFLSPSNVARKILTKRDFGATDILRYIEICLIYGYMDYALAIAEVGKQSLGEDLYFIVNQSLSESGIQKDPFSWLPGRDRIAYRLKLMGQRMQRPHEYWRRHGSDSFLGNKNPK